MLERFLILWHFARTRWGPPPRDRTALLARQQRALQRFLKRLVRDSPYYRGLPPQLAALPVLAKPDFLDHFAALNRRGVSLEEATAVALRAEAERDFRPELPGGLTVGLSSGTSGRRQVFLVSRADRCRWAGQLLARLLEPASLRQMLRPSAPPLRIAFFLRANSNLYTTLSSRRLRFHYHDLTRPFPLLLQELAAQAPDILVAPATVLAEIVRREQAAPSGIRPRQIVSVAEVLDARDRAAIEAAFGVKVAEIYQAAEGFLGSTCPEGHLHLHEEDLQVEPEWLDESRDRFHPLITDFSRSGQWFVRYRLDDILRLDPHPCPCGRETRRLRNIEGRAEEVLWLPDFQGRLAPIFPDALRQALYAMSQPPERYRISQHGLRWDIRLQPAHSDLQQAVASALANLLASLMLPPPVFDFQPWTDQPAEEKQRRIRCIDRPA